jgi:hypothetical protein
VPSAPAASCAHGVVSMRTSVHSEFTGNRPAFPHAMVLRLMPCSPRRRIRLATVIGELTVLKARLGSQHLRRLSTSNGCQDHTVLPYAATRLRLKASPGSPVFAERLCRALAPSSCVPEIAHGEQSALRPRRTPDAAASTASHPASVTIAIRPLCGTRRERICS